MLIAALQAFDTEMQSFFYLFTRYLAKRAHAQELYVAHTIRFTQSSLTSCMYSDWDRINSPSDDKIVPYSKLSAGDNKNLNKLAVLKVNGGLGTSMGESITLLP